MKQPATLLNGPFNVAYDSVLLQDIMFRYKNHICILERSIVLSLCQVIYVNHIRMIACSLWDSAGISTLYLHVKMVALPIHCVNI